MLYEIWTIYYASSETKLIRDLENRASNSFGWADKESLRRSRKLWMRVNLCSAMASLPNSFKPQNAPDYKKK